MSERTMSPNYIAEMAHNPAFRVVFTCTCNVNDIRPDADGTIARCENCHRQVKFDVPRPQ